MRAAVLHGPGAPSAFQLEDVPAPVPGAGEVLLQVAGCGVSSRDVVERNGTYKRDVTYPLIQGLEISGTVVARGSEADLEVGDTVCSKAFSSCGRCRFCRTGRETTCLLRRPVRGGYAELVALPAEALVKIPAALSLIEACVLGPTAGVALNAVRDIARVSIGDTVLVTGATGGVGWVAVQLAKLAGARVIALTRSPGKREALLEAGADDVVIAGSTDFSKEVRALTPDNAGVDVVIDNVGSLVFDASFNSLGLHGRYAFVGELVGQEVRINPARIFFKRVQLLGVGSVSRAQLEDVVRLAAAGRIAPKIAAVLPLEDVAEAHRLVESGELLGRIVIDPRTRKV